MPFTPSSRAPGPGGRLRAAARWLTALAAAALVVTGSTRAHAVPAFPAELAKTLGASTAPPCAVCHVDGRVGRGTVNTPFGAAMRARGLVAYDVASLNAALAGMERDGVDSDGDGVPDVQALREGRDPNPTGGAEDVTKPTYGCVGRVAPTAPSEPLPLAPVAIMAGLVVVAARRRRKGGVAPFIAFMIVGAGAAACASGERLSPRAEAARAPSPPRMAPLARSRMAEDLRAAGLDPAALPTFDKLEPRQVRRVMGTFTRALGVGCTHCHDADNPEAPTRAKRIATRMWNEFTRGSVAGGAPLYCDSCHQGQAKYLDRRGRNDLEVYMSDSFTEKIKRGGKEIECETCHGDPAEPEILRKW